jgi:hypothetical protein
MAHLDSQTVTDTSVSFPLLAPGALQYGCVREAQRGTVAQTLAQTKQRNVAMEEPPSYKLNVSVDMLLALA